jgi:hypothetical protein
MKLVYNYKKYMNKFKRSLNTMLNLSDLLFINDVLHLLIIYLYKNII